MAPLNGNNEMEKLVLNQSCQRAWGLFREVNGNRYQKGVEIKESMIRYPVIEGSMSQRPEIE